MSVGPINGATDTSGSSSSSSNKQIGLTSNQFLSLLATQLQNQNPLNPTDPNEFTNQMVQYAGLSEQIDMNSSLGTMSSTMSDILTKVSLLASANDQPAQS